MSELYNSIEELMLELEDEDGDPVGGRTLAIVPGAFKPPHLGHVDMVRQYSKMADEVIVLISSPIKASRGIGGKPITAKQSEQIWKLFLDADQGLSNVRVKISKVPSPITATYEEIGEDGPLEPGTRLILGASKKGGDFKRWKGAAKYVKPGVELLPPAETAVIPANRPNGEPYSATDARKMLEQGENADEFFGDGMGSKVRKILGLESLEEMSAMGGGAVQGSAASADEEERKTLTREQNKKTKHPPYNELYLYKEVLKLLMKEGIIK
jgi:cytidyltransferase-like protein